MVNEFLMCFHVFDTDKKLWMANNENNQQVEMQA